MEAVQVVFGGGGMGETPRELQLVKPVSSIPRLAAIC